MQREIRRVVVLIVGWLLIAVGIVGLFLPVLQGVLFILVGLAVLSRESEIARRWLQSARGRYPKADVKLKEWGRWWRMRFGRTSGDE